MNDDDDVLRTRIEEILASQPELGYRSLHASLQAEDDFAGVGLKRVQRALKQTKRLPGAAFSGLLLLWLFL